MQMDMEIFSGKPALSGGNKRSPTSYTQNCKRVGVLKKYEGDMDRWGKWQIQKKMQCYKDKACIYWLAGNYRYTGDDCKYLHSHIIGGSDVTFLTKLVGHNNKPIRGIAFPSHTDSAKLYSAGDNKLIAWDCHTGQGTEIPLEGASEVGCLLDEGPWLFVGLPNAVRAWNALTSTELSLDCPRGQVRALAAVNEMLFAGTHDGTVLAWKFNSAANTFKPATALMGHTLPVVSFVSVADRRFSGSMDSTIRVLRDHTSVVMSLLFWDRFLLSCCLDNTVKVWAATSTGALEVIHTHNEEHVQRIRYTILKKQGASISDWT